MGITSDPTDECIKIIRPDGMQECYLVLPETERAKGFARPVRQEYIHLKCGTKTWMNLAISETYARNPKFYGGTYCVACRTHFDLQSLNFEEPNAHLVMFNGNPVLAHHFAWLGSDGELDGSYVGE